MRHYVISELFFKSIAEKGNLYSRIWMYWLGSFVDELFDKDFLEKQVKSLPKLDESEIREIYHFGVQTLQQDFKINQNKKTKSPKVIDKESAKLAKEVIDYLNAMAGTTYISHGKGSSGNVEIVVSRINDGFTVSDFKIVIDKKVKDWKGSDYEKYLRPITIFAKTKFENYLNASNNESKPSKKFDTFADSVAQAAEAIRLREKR